jgi:hypothetical protein
MLQHFTRHFKKKHNFTNIKHYTQVYNTFTQQRRVQYFTTLVHNFHRNYYKTILLQNFTKHYNITQVSAKLYTTLQNCPKLNTNIQHFAAFFQICTQFYEKIYTTTKLNTTIQKLHKTLHNFTTLYTILQHV